MLRLLDGAAGLMGMGIAGLGAALGGTPGCGAHAHTHSLYDPPRSLQHIDRSCQFGCRHSLWLAERMGPARNCLHSLAEGMQRFTVSYNLPEEENIFLLLTRT